MTSADQVTRQTLSEVADGTYAYVQSPGGWCMSNAGVLVADEGVIVIDTLATQRRAQRLREAVDGLTAGPRRIVVNTHHHGDHTFGNYVFGPAATIIAHERALAEMTETGLALTALWPDVEWGAVRVTLPAVTVVGRAGLTLGQHTAQLIDVGPAHTTNDIVVWLPAAGVLFAGDVLMSGCAPFCLMGSVSGSLAAIDRLRALRPRTVVCGHGPVAGPEVLDENAAYLRWIQDVAAEGTESKQSPLQTALDAGAGAFGHLLDQERIVGNLHRAYAELTGAVPGAPLDLAGVFGEMIAYNGGNLPPCLA